MNTILTIFKNFKTIRIIFTVFAPKLKTLLNLLVAKSIISIIFIFTSWNVPQTLAKFENRWIYSAPLLEPKSNYSLVFGRTLSRYMLGESAHCADSTWRTLLHEATPNFVEQLLTKPTQTGRNDKALSWGQKRSWIVWTDGRTWRQSNQKQMTTSPGWLGLNLIGLECDGTEQRGVKGGTGNGVWPFVF